MSTCDRCGATTAPTARVCRACGKVVANAPRRKGAEIDHDKTVDRSVVICLTASPVTSGPVEPTAHAAAVEPALPTETIQGPADTTSIGPSSPLAQPSPLPTHSPPGIPTASTLGGSRHLSPPAPFWARVRASWEVPSGAPAPPTQLWAVIGMLGLIGIGSVGWSIYWAAKAFDLFSLGRFGVAVGVFVLGVLAIPLTFGLGCIYLARRLQATDRVARVLTVVLCLSAASAFVLSGARDLELVLVALVCTCVAMMLLADPATKNHFTARPDAVWGSEPSPVVASRVLIVIVGCCIFLVGAMLLPLSEIDGRLFVYGLLDIGIATLIFWLSRRLSRGDPGARVLVTGLAFAYAALSLVVGHGEPGVILPVGLALGTVGLLWLPRSSRVYFASLPRPSQPAVAAAERVIEGLISSLTTASSPKVNSPAPGSFTRSHRRWRRRATCGPLQRDLFPPQMSPTSRLPP